MQKMSEIYFMRKPDEIYFKSTTSSLCIRTYSLVMSQSLYMNKTLRRCNVDNFLRSDDTYTFVRSNARRLISAYNKKILFRNGSLSKYFLLCSTGLQSVTNFEEYIKILIYRKKNGLFIDRHFRVIPQFDGYGNCINIDNLAEGIHYNHPELTQIFSIKTKSSLELARTKEIFMLDSCNRYLSNILEEYLNLE